jgi:hypothetical protein
MDLVRRAPDDGDRPRHLLAELGQRERRTDDRARNRSVPARVNGLDGSVGPNRGNGVVETDEADGPPGTAAAERRQERRLHASDASLHLQPTRLERLAEVTRAFTLRVTELRVLVDELHRGTDRVGLPPDCSEKLLALDHAST